MVELRDAYPGLPALMLSQYVAPAYAASLLESKATGGAMFGLGITSMLLIIFTLGLAMPWVVCRTLSFWCDNLVLRGPLDIEAVRQESMKGVDATGEALADALDIGAGL